MPRPGRAPGGWPTGALETSEPDRLGRVSGAANPEHSESPIHIRGRVLPALLAQLLETGQWRHPGDNVLHEVMPWYEDPLDFLSDNDEIRRESRHCLPGG